MKQFTIFILTVCIATITMAQKKDSKNIANDKKAERMATELSLTKTEQQQVKTLLEQQESEYRATKENLKATDADYKQKLQNLHKKHEAQLEKLLGSEKMAKLNNNRKQAMERFEAAKQRIQSRVTVN